MIRFLFALWPLVPLAAVVFRVVRKLGRGEKTLGQWLEAEVAPLLPPPVIVGAVIPVAFVVACWAAWAGPQS